MNPQEQQERDQQENTTAQALQSLGRFCRRAQSLLQRKRKTDEPAADQEREARERKQSEEHNRLAILAANEGHWYWDLKTDKITFSTAWAAMLGIEDQDISDDPEEWFGRVHTYHLPELKRTLLSRLSWNRRKAFRR